MNAVEYVRMDDWLSRDSRRPAACTRMYILMAVAGRAVVAPLTLSESPFMLHLPNSVLLSVLTITLASHLRHRRARCAAAPHAIPLLTIIWQAAVARNLCKEDCGLPLDGSH